MKKGVGCDVTIFNGNLRYATTLGADYIGTEMSGEVKKAVLDNGQLYNGQIYIKDEPYYVSYSPMYDVNHTLVGAYFAGSNVSEANKEFNFVRMVMILSGIVIAVICAVIVMRFARKQIAVPIDNKNKPPEQIVNAIKRRVDDFQPENESFDDVTMMSILWKDSDNRGGDK